MIYIAKLPVIMNYKSSGAGAWLHIFFRLLHCMTRRFRLAFAQQSFHLAVACYLVGFKGSWVAPSHVVQKEQLETEVCLIFIHPYPALKN